MNEDFNFWSVSDILLSMFCRQNTTLFTQENIPKKLYIKTLVTIETECVVSNNTLHKIYKTYSLKCVTSLGQCFNLCDTHRRGSFDQGKLKVSRSFRSRKFLVFPCRSTYFPSTFASGPIFFCKGSSILNSNFYFHKFQ